MNNDIYITVVIKKTESNNSQQPHAVQVEKQVDSDQGSKLTRFRAYLPLVVGFAFKKLIDFIIDKF
ncbi:MAG: hypothetical protein WC856_19120 [Methylococcaceae bacterium]|jgi:hypothetical protein